MKTRRILALILCAALALALVACAPTDNTPNAPDTGDVAPPVNSGGDKGTIGFSVYDMQYEFFQIMEQGTRAEIERLGYKYQLHDQKSDETEMVTGAINLINSGIQALIISPCKPEALSSIVAAAKEKNIPVVVDDIGGGGADYDAIVISDCYQGGQQAADYAVELLTGKEGSKKVAIIKCEPEAVYAIRRGEGFKANITAAGYNVVAEVSGHSKSEEGYSIMQDLLASNADLVAVFAENDPMAVGAANALADAGRSDIVVIGFNNDPEAVDAMKNGIMAATVAQYPDEMGKLTVQLADKFINGEAVTYDDPNTREIFAEVRLIKAANLNSEKGTIGFSVYDMQYEFFQIMEKGTRAEIERLGYKYQLHDQKGDETEMVTGAINLINSGIQALIISPCKPEALSSIVAAAKEKNIPVVVDDIGGGGADYDAIVISNCYQGGQQAADYAAELLTGKEGSKKVAIIKCEPEAVYAIRRGEGFKANIAAAGYNVVAEVSGHSKSEEGYSIMQDLLASNPDLVAVFAENDPMAVGAANALADAGRSDVIVIGFNNDPEAVDAMKNGIMAATVAQYPDEMGKLTVQLADKFINGETVNYDDPATREIFAAVKLIKASDVR
ncbi:MAG: substrate-binding domain-containing protein [Oscillospiraceae bacterium]|jgi:ribose transport system substrate-binding protein|nr:substrate-binding domain-containing protein [Oscillospiraceae bacterium]